MIAGIKLGPRGGKRRPPRSCGRHPSYFFSHSGVDIWFIEKDGGWLSYWYSTLPGIYAETREGRASEPSFDVRQMPYPFTISEGNLGVEEDYRRAYAQMRAAHRLAITGAIDAGVWLDLLDPKFTLPRFAACPLRSRPWLEPTDEIPF